MEVFILRAREQLTETKSAFVIKGVFSTAVKAKKERLKNPDRNNMVWQLECWDVDGDFKWCQFI